jgi:hypothetical protein
LSRWSFTPEAILIKEELEVRFAGQLPEYPQNTLFEKINVKIGMGIFDGHFTGAKPIQMGADLLEYWASHLP